MQHDPKDHLCCLHCEKDAHYPHTEMVCTKTTDSEDWYESGKKDGVEEWIRENQPITNFTCSGHKNPIPDCFQCRKNEQKEGYEEGVRDALEVLPECTHPTNIICAICHSRWGIARLLDT